MISHFWVNFLFNRTSFPKPEHKLSGIWLKNEIKSCLRKKLPCKWFFQDLRQSHIFHNPKAGLAGSNIKSLSKNRENKKGKVLFCKQIPHGQYSLQRKNTCSSSTCNVSIFIINHVKLAWNKLTENISFISRSLKMMVWYGCRIINRSFMYCGKSAVNSPVDESVLVHSCRSDTRVKLIHPSLSVKTSPTTQKLLHLFLLKKRLKVKHNRLLVLNAWKPVTLM